ncbi:MAG: metallophosphoesterase, partial [bacterium]
LKISLSNENIIIGPYLQNITSNEVIIKWQTNIKTKGKILYFSKNNFLKKPKPIEIVEEKENIFHQIKISNLKENTTYCYKIITQKKDLEINTFKTPSSKCNFFSFVVYGETLENEIHSCLIDLFKEQKIFFILHTGNLSSYENENSLKNQFFNPLKNIIKEKPIFTCPGNLEKEKNSFYSDYFNFPFDEKGYSFNYGNAHFIALDSNSEWEKESPEFQWLEQDLKQSINFKWKIVFFHHSPFTFSSKNSNLKIRNNLCHLFYQYGIDLVFSGKNHFYECSFPIRAGNFDDKYATTFVTTANGDENFFHKKSQSVWTRLFKNIPHYCFISIQKNQLTLKAIDINKNVFDIFTIDKKNSWFKQKYLLSSMTQFNIEKIDLIRPQIKIPSLNFDKKEQKIKIKINTDFSEICKGQIFWKTDKNYSIDPQKVDFEIKKEQPFEKEFQVNILSAYLYPTPIMQTSISHEKITSKVENSLQIRKQFFCSKTKEKIQLDGFLNENLWTEKKPQTDFVAITGNFLNKKRTAFFITYDDENLYIGVDCEESDVEKLFHNALGKDDERVWKDDCIEVLINFSSDKNFQFIANCLGVQFDSKNSNTEWNGKWQSYGVINELGWSIEFVIPLKDLETTTPQNGEIWNFNISRNNNPQNVYTQWSPSYTHTEQASLLGELIFE